MTELTTFGFSPIAVEQKKAAVATVFDSVSRKYDLMNDLMTLGMHRGWKRRAIATAGLRGGENVLDVASGTGDIAIGLANAVGHHGTVTATDINPSMLAGGRRKIEHRADRAIFSFREADAENLPFEDDSFDAVTISFGLRNVTDKQQALREMRRVLRPGGRLVILEFSRPVDPIVRPLYDAYSFKWLPVLGDALLNDGPAYRYLAESIRVHPDRYTLRDNLVEAGYDDVAVTKLLFGIVAIHSGIKPA